MGRPNTGALSSYPLELINRIRLLRENYPAWGAQSIRIELAVYYKYALNELPSIASIDRYLKQKGLVKSKAPQRVLPQKKPAPKITRPHQLWELDAQGANLVEGIGYQSMINIKDVYSRVHCMAFPVPVKSRNSKPKAKHYYWSLRLAFEQWGLPRSIRVDKESVFYENTSRSPFPQQLHMWLLSLGVELCFLTKAPPQQNAIIERSHQTMDKQVMIGQSYQSWKQLWQNCQHRRQIMNEKLPNRTLGGKAPLQAFPKAIYSNRSYKVEQEKELIDLKRVYRYLAKCQWFRKVSKVRTLSLGAVIYYLKDAPIQKHVQIRFCNRSKRLIFQDDKERQLGRLPIQNIEMNKIAGLNTKRLSAIKYQLFHRKDCPL
ncbi:MAG: hypothetical protein AAF990_22920 [Bacteroidota bacterium]